MAAAVQTIDKEARQTPGKVVGESTAAKALKKAQRRREAESPILGYGTTCKELVIFQGLDARTLLSISAAASGMRMHQGVENGAGAIEYISRTCLFWFRPQFRKALRLTSFLTFSSLHHACFLQLCCASTLL